MATNGSIPTKPPSDPDLSDITWTWLKFVWQWIIGETNVTPSQGSSFTASDSFCYPCDATAGAIIVTLPLVSTCIGKKYLIKKTDTSANTVTLTAVGTDTIDGSTTKVISTRYQELEIISDGVSKWHIVGFYSTGAASGPGGSNLDVQFNDNGVFGGSNNFVYDKTSNTLAVGEVDVGSAAGTGFFRALSTGTGALPITGKGVEINYSSAADLGVIASFDRTNTLYKPLLYSALSHQFFVSGSIEATINSGGFGIGTGASPPTAWSNSDGTIQIGASIQLASAPPSNTYFTNNLYFNTSWKYNSNNAGTIRFVDSGGITYWFTAPVNAGGAGAAATITERMRLDLSGKLGIGVAAAYQLDVNGDTNIATANSYRIGGIKVIDIGGGYTDLYSGDGGRLGFQVGPAGDPGVYSNNDTVHFRDAGQSEYAKIDKTVGLTLEIVGHGIRIKEGANARMGVATLILGVAVVSNTSVTANSRIFLSVESLGTVTVPTTVAVTARTAGTSFTITSANLTDTSVVSWFIMEPA